MKAKPCDLNAVTNVIFLSDGFSESQNSTGDFFAMERVQEVCESLREKTPEEILCRMTEAVVSYSCDRPQQDDRTAAILRYLPNELGAETSRAG